MRKEASFCAKISAEVEITKLYLFCNHCDVRLSSSSSLLEQQQQHQHQQQQQPQHQKQQQQQQQQLSEKSERQDNNQVWKRHFN